jgi:hypothetical protein
MNKMQKVGTNSMPMPEDAGRNAGLLETHRICCGTRLKSTQQEPFGHEPLVERNAMCNRVASIPFSKASSETATMH